MSYVATDGRRFPTTIQGRKYDDWLRENDKVPGGALHSHDLKMHGHVKEFRIIREATNGRHRVEAVHADGFVHKSVHPDAQRAHSIGAELLGLAPPPSNQVHLRARSQPVGTKEEERVASEDSRDVHDLMG